MGMETKTDWIMMTRKSPAAKQWQNDAGADAAAEGRTLSGAASNSWRRSAPNQALKTVTLLATFLLLSSPFSQASVTEATSSISQATSSLSEATSSVPEATAFISEANSSKSEAPLTVTAATLSKTEATLPKPEVIAEGEIPVFAAMEDHDAILECPISYGKLLFFFLCGELCNYA